MDAHGIADRVYPEAPDQASEERGDAITQQLHVAVDGDAVHGGVWLHLHDFRAPGGTVRAGWLKYPVAESLVDRAFNGVPAALILHAMREQPKLMALGMGGTTTPIARLLTGLGWRLVEVPFLLLPVRPRRIVLELPRLHGSSTAQRLTRGAARSGFVSAAAAPLSLYRFMRESLAARGCEASLVAEFGVWTDEVWRRCAPAYGFVARRDAALLNQFYQPDFPGLTRIRVCRAGEDVGWLCTTMSTRTEAHPQFGRLRVGMLADGLAMPDDAAAVLALGVRHLVRSGADLIVANHLHPRWIAALRSLGFVGSRSNFVFARSKAIAAELDGPLDSGDVFLNRGDCDGPPLW